MCADGWVSLAFFLHDQRHHPEYRQTHGHIGQYGGWAEGRSFDRYGNELDIHEYFTARKEVNEDRQREEEYTKLLAERIIDRYHIENVVLSSHLTAFAVFEMLLHENPNFDLFGILRLPPDDYMFPFHAVAEVVEQMQARLFQWEQQGKIRLAPEIHRSQKMWCAMASKIWAFFTRKNR